MEVAKLLLSVVGAMLLSALSFMCRLRRAATANLANHNIDDVALGYVCAAMKEDDVCA